MKKLIILVLLLVGCRQLPAVDDLDPRLAFWAYYGSQGLVAANFIFGSLEEKVEASKQLMEQAEKRGLRYQLIINEAEEGRGLIVLAPYQPFKGDSLLLLTAGHRLHYLFAMAAITSFYKKDNKIILTTDDATLYYQFDKDQLQVWPRTTYHRVGDGFIVDNDFYYFTGERFSSIVKLNLNNGQESIITLPSSFTAERLLVVDDTLYLTATQRNDDKLYLFSVKGEELINYPITNTMQLLPKPPVTLAALEPTISWLQHYGLMITEDERRGFFEDHDYIVISETN